MLEAALVGYQAHLETIEARMAEIRKQLGTRAKPQSTATTSNGRGGKRTLSAAARKRIAAAQRKRWAAFKRAKAAK